MKWIFLNYLFDRGYFVNSSGKVCEHVPETVSSLGRLFGIRIVSGAEYLTMEMIHTASARMGVNVPLPFYRGFPDTVRSLFPEERLFDQLVHYMRTYDFGLFDEPGRSILEPEFERLAFAEKTEIRDFSVLTEAEAVRELEELVRALLAGTRPLSTEQFGLVREFIQTYGWFPENCASRNTALRLSAELRDFRFAKFLALSDVIKLVEEIQYRVYKKENIRKLNLRNQDRKFIARMIDSLFEADRCDLRQCCERKALWSGLLHHLHYRPGSAKAVEFVNTIRGKRNGSVSSEFEAAMRAGKVNDAVSILLDRKGVAAVLRSLDYILSRCGSDREVRSVLDRIDGENLIIMIQLIFRYSRRENAFRVFRFTRFEKLRIHEETESEMRRRKSGLPVETRTLVLGALRAKLEQKLKGRSGKVYLDPKMRGIALPLQETVAQGGFGTLPRGSRLPFPPGKKIRAFTYWEKVDDIDLSAIGLREDGSYQEFSWRTMSDRTGDGIVYSGDQTSGYDGGSEYFDVDPVLFRKRYPSVRYLVFCDNVFSGVPFSSCICRAGYMIRDRIDSGEVFEPKTVQSSFAANGQSTFCYLFALDLDANDFIWLNISRKSQARIAGTTDFAFLLDDFRTTDVMNVYEFFKLMATELVDDPIDADVVVTDGAAALKEGAELIRSWDTERMIALLNLPRA